VCMYFIFDELSFCDKEDGQTIFPKPRDYRKDL